MKLEHRGHFWAPDEKKIYLKKREEKEECVFMLSLLLVLDFHSVVM